jgi:hypothetical protein
MHHALVGARRRLEGYGVSRDRGSAMTDAPTRSGAGVAARQCLHVHNDARHRPAGAHGAPGCWCCEDQTVQASVLRLTEHPEVGVCFRCVQELSRRKRQIERQTRHAPPDLSWWQRAKYRSGFAHC